MRARVFMWMEFVKPVQVKQMAQGQLWTMIAMTTVSAMRMKLKGVRIPRPAILTGPLQMKTVHVRIVAATI